MLRPETEIYIDRLGDALRMSFNWVVQDDRKRAAPDIAIAWAELTASALHDAQLLIPPFHDASQPPLPLIETPWMRTELFHVAASGMGGGPALDVILQIWFDIGDLSGGFGIPLLMRKVPHAGRMPDLIWDDLREAARRLIVATPAGRCVLFSDGTDFRWAGPRDTPPGPVVVMEAHGLANLRSPPHPATGRMHPHFFHDLASGWIGDPALSGRENSPVLDELLCNFHVGRVLRIRIVRDLV